MRICALRCGSQEDEGAASDDGYNPSPTPVAAGLGELAGRPACALNMRHAFLNGKPPYLLYYWEVVDSEQLLALSLQ